MKIALKTPPGPTGPPTGYSPYQNQLGFGLNSTLFDNKEWPSTLLHEQISASRTVLFFRIITISMFTFTA